MYKIQTDMPKYRKYCKMVGEVMAEFDPLFEAVGLDEGYLDLTEKLTNSKEHQHTLEDRALKIMQNIQRQVALKTGGLTLSFGMAPNRALAKLCSDINKPNGIFILQRNKQEISKFLDSFPLRKIKNIGPHNERIISGLGRSY